MDRGSDAAMWWEKFARCFGWGSERKKSTSTAFFPPSPALNRSFSTPVSVFSTHVQNQSEARSRSLWTPPSAFPLGFGRLGTIHVLSAMQRFHPALRCERSEAVRLSAASERHSLGVVSSSARSFRSSLLPLTLRLLFRLSAHKSPRLEAVRGDEEPHTARIARDPSPRHASCFRSANFGRDYTRLILKVCMQRGSNGVHASPRGKTSCVDERV